MQYLSRVLCQQCPLTAVFVGYKLLAVLQIENYMLLPLSDRVQWTALLQHRPCLLVVLLEKRAVPLVVLEENVDHMTGHNNIANNSHLGRSCLKCLNCTLTLFNRLLRKCSVRSQELLAHTCLTSHTITFSAHYRTSPF